MKSTKLLLGLAVGAAVIYLFTTERGKKMRGDMADRASDWGDSLSDLASSAGNKLSDLRDAVSSKIEGLSGDARKKILAILDEGKETADGIKSKAKKEMA